jgi:hypothetical protein
MAATLSCDPDAFLNVTTSLGRPNPDDDTPGKRGTINAVFINNTRYRASLTTGVFDPQDQKTVPIAVQFFDSTTASERLEAGQTTSAITLTCSRAWAVGSDQLIELLQTTNQANSLDAVALQRGVQFFGDDLTTPEVENNLVGTAEPVTALLGVDYQCESLISFRLEELSAGEFVVEFDVVLP